VPIKGVFRRLLTSSLSLYQRYEHLIILTLIGLIAIVGGAAMWKLDFEDPVWPRRHCPPVHGYGIRISMDVFGNRLFFAKLPSQLSLRQN
jgi:hypothetical protein